MPFTPKNWLDSPSTSTPLSAAAIEDLETRVTNYTDDARQAISVTDYGAVGDNVVDDTAAIQAALDAANTRIGDVWFPPGFYKVTSTLTVPDFVSCIGSSLITGGSAALYHNFNGNLFELEESSKLKNLYLINNGAYTGAAIYHVTPDATSRGFFEFERVVITDPISDRGWERDVYLDGTTGSQGIRSVFFHQCQFFGAYTPGETVVLKEAIHCFFSACEMMQAPQTSVVVGVTLYGTTSEDIHFTGCGIDGDFWTEANGMIFSGRIGTGRTITCAAGSNHNIFMGDVDRATFVNSGAATNRIETKSARGARVTKTGTQSLTSATRTSIAFDAEDFDTDVMHDNVTNNTRLTVVRAGKYRIYGAIVFAPSTVGERTILFRKNAASTLGGHQGAPNPTAADATVVSSATTADLAVGDYVECQGQQISGGNLDVQTISTSAGNIPTHFGMELIGP